jgi:hypothetical protein
MRCVTVVDPSFFDDSNFFNMFKGQKPKIIYVIEVKFACSNTWLHRIPLHMYYVKCITPEHGPCDVVITRTNRFKPV